VLFRSRILAHIFLNAEERDEWRSLTGNVRRRREWLLGRACIKEAVRYWIYQQTGELLYSSDVMVMHDELGAPYVDGWWRATLVDAPEISLSHDSFACLVAVADPAERVGVDREELGRVQKPELVREALTPNEQALLAGLAGVELEDRLLRIWCAKEAAAKCLGLGLKGVPAAFEVSFRDSDYEKAYVEHADIPVHVAVIRQQSSIIALASGLEREIQ
jgi:phosphopantetheinyl transferase (holo-ACP synthase)